MKRKIHFDHVRLNPSEQIGLHQQPTWELSLVIRGEGTRTIGDTTEPFHCGEVVLIPPGLPHRWRFSESADPIENVAVMFQTDLMETMRICFPTVYHPLERLLSIEDAVVFSGETARILKEGLLGMETMTDAARTSLLVHLLVIVAESHEQRIVGRRKRETTAQQRIKQIETFITCNYKRNIAITDVARHMAMNASALSSFYHRQTGRTLTTFLTNVRLGQARHLLSHTLLTIQQVCFESGFNDVPHFCRVFKQAMGMTPKEYRNQ